MRARLGFLMLVSVLLSACGGGGDGNGPPGGFGSLCVKTGEEQPGLIEVATASEGGGGSGGEGGAGDGAGSLGQFRNAVVIVRDANLREMARTQTDEQGKVTIRFSEKCRGPIEVEYKGGPGATYFDEASGQSEPYPEGQVLRARFPLMPAEFGVTPYTEAAVRLMDSGPGGPVKTLEPDAINRANQHIAEVLTDQLAGTFRSKSDAFGLVNITQQPVLVNETNFKTPGTLTDTPGGRYAAIIAGLIRGANTFAGGSGSGGGASAAPSPALRTTAQFIEDLSDGQLDLQGPNGPVLQGTEAPAYTYETLWRAKTVAAGLTSQGAGDTALRQSSAATKVAEYVFSLSESYRTATCLGQPNCDPYEAKSTAGQTITLYADGRLTTQRSVSASFGVNRATHGLRTTPTEQEVVMADPATGANARFVDVKMGTRGQVIALQQDRKAFVYIQPIEPYIARGDELAGEPSAYYRAFLEPRLVVNQQRVVPGGGADLRVVSFTSSPAPEDRTFPGVPVPSFVYVLSDGTLWAASLADPTRPIALPQPEPLQSVVYDQFVPPGFDAAYGRPPAGIQQLPWTGPRRLFGLTRSGTVRTWLEGESATGVLLEVPGKVVLLAAESKTGVFALTGDGKVFWINADQAHAAAAGSTITRQPTLQNYPRRFPLHHVQPVNGLDDVPICWLARTEAIACKSGEVYRWSEALARFEYTEPGSAGDVRHSTFVPVGDAIQATRVAGVPPFWRISAVDEFFLARSPGRTIDVAGLRFLKTDGASTTLEEASDPPQRNLATTLHGFGPRGDEPAGEHGYLTGLQFRKALESLFNAGGPINIERSSTTPPGARRLLHGIAPSTDPVSENRFDFRVPIDGDSDPNHPNVNFKIELRSSDAGIESFQVTNMRLGDTDAGGSPGGSPIDGLAASVPAPQGGVFRDDEFIRADVTLRAWQLYYQRPVHVTTDGSGSVARLRLIPMFIQGRPYDFRLCFAADGQSEVASVRFARVACTEHDNFGAFLRKTTGLASHTPFLNGQRNGAATDIDFGQVYGD